MADGKKADLVHDGEREPKGASPTKKQANDKKAKSKDKTDKDKKDKKETKEKKDKKDKSKHLKKGKEGAAQKDDCKSKKRKGTPQKEKAKRSKRGKNKSQGNRIYTLRVPEFLTHGADDVLYDPEDTHLLFHNDYDMTFGQQLI